MKACACADTPEVEEARDAYINRRMGRCYVRMHLFGVAVLSFDKGLEVLEGALAIGRQADPLGPDEVQARIDAAHARTGKPFFSKAKSWLTMEEAKPAG